MLQRHQDMVIDFQNVSMFAALYEPCHEKTRFVHMRKQAQIITAKLISTFVFTIQVVQFLFFLYPKFHASSHLLRLYSSVCVGPLRKLNC